jgi:hypothetical protein|tara:strand:+ start:594 stop:803 length:210 start_codon:yes stop_codon:yes gene_type:complete
MKTGPKQKHNNHKNCKTGWRYKKDAPYDLKWQEDRSKLFKESGNGWWILKGTPELIKHLDRIKKENEMP